MQPPWSSAAHDKIFICYRRADSQGFAGRLADSLTSYFGRDRVFRDVTDIDYGKDFEKEIDEKLSHSGAVIVVIGEKWRSLKGKGDKPRLFEKDDHVCREIQLALQRDGLPIVPVLIGNARMPSGEELPDAIRDLSKRNAITLTDERWEFDVSRLMKILSIDLANSVAQRRLDWMLWVAIAALLAGVAYVAIDFTGALGARPNANDLKDAGFTPLESAIPFFGILLAGLLAAFGAQYMEVARRKYAWAAFVIAAVGTASAFIGYAQLNVAEPDWSLVLTFSASMALAVAVLACMALARFKAE